MKKFGLATPLALMAGVYLLSTFLHGVFDVYDRWTWFDIPMHFTGGFLAGMLGLAIYRKTTTERHRREVHPWHQLFFVLGVTVMVAVVWEWHEFIRDWLNRGETDWTLMQPTSTDTMTDLLVGLLGGLSAALLLKKEK